MLGSELELHVFIDDIIIINSTCNLDMLQQIFRRLQNTNLKINPEKCKFYVDQLKYLRHIVDREGIRTDSEKVVGRCHRTVKQIQQFLGVAS